MSFVSLERLLDNLAAAAPRRRSQRRAHRASPRHRRASRSLNLERLECRNLFAADVIITEFLADNENGIRDVDGERGDWVEVYNRGDAVQNMAGWRLTDSASQLSKWVFPSITINPGQSVLVWATSKNRTNPAAELHTNFGLSRGGEYLALVRPDNTIATQFAPGFPAQFPDLSYGYATTSVGGVITVQTGQAPRFFGTTTPGTPNVAGTLDVRPFISEVSHSAASDTIDQSVIATVIPTGAPIAVAGVQLHYRVMYGQEVVVNMFDDGAHGDGAAGDGKYGGKIPAAASSPGQMVRYYVSASTTTNAVGRFPLFTNPQTTSQYLGSVIPDPTVTSNLPIFQVFVQNPYWFWNTNGTVNRSITSGSFFYNGRFYDNVLLNVRGDSTVTDAYPNQKFKIEFPEDNEFDFGDGRETAGSINIDNVYRDPSYARLVIGSELFRDAGAYAQLVEPVQFRMNGQFYSLGIYSERFRKPFLRRNGLDEEGALYESEGLRDSQGFLRPDAGNLGTTAGMQKDNREWDPTGFADLQAFVNGISPSNPLREQYIFNNVNVPEVLNALAGYALTKHFDKDTHNFYVYRDSDGTGEWSLLPYDLDLIWDRLIEPLYNRDYFSGHPFEGRSEDPTWAGTHWNRLIDAFADSPTLSQMLLRRLRTLMDELLQPTSTPYAQRRLENKIDALFAEVYPDAALDYAKWGQNDGGSWGGPWPLGSGVAVLKQNLNLRRNYLYGLSIIPQAQSASATVQIGNIDVTPATGVPGHEFIQIYNPTSAAVDISGWRVSGAVEYQFAKGVVLPAFGSVYITPNVNEFRTRATGLFVQGGYTGDLSPAGETINLLRPNGTLAHSLTYAPIPQVPELGQIADQTITSGVPSAPILLPATDADTPTASLTFSGTVQSQLYQLDQQYNIVPAGPASDPYYFNNRGQNEKYFHSPTGTHPTDAWFYLLPNGDFYVFTGVLQAGSPLVGNLLTNVGTQAWQNPTLLNNAQPQTIPATFQFQTGASPTVRISTTAGYLGNFVATITVSDGVRTDSQKFVVRVEEAPPVVPGDYDGNQTVGAGDLAVWGRQLGDVAPGGQSADGDADGDVDGADFLLWQGNFGVVATGLASGSVQTHAAVLAAESRDALTVSMTSAELQSIAQAADGSPVARGPAALQSQTRETPCQSDQFETATSWRFDGPSALEPDAVERARETAFESPRIEDELLTENGLAVEAFAAAFASLGQ